MGDLRNIYFPKCSETKPLSELHFWRIVATPLQHSSPIVSEEIREDELDGGMSLLGQIGYSISEPFRRLLREVTRE